MADNIMGNRIKALRKGKGLTQTDLGNMLGLKPQAINKYETGIVKNLKQSTIFKLAEIFDVPPSYIMGSSDLSSIENLRPVGKTKKIPILGEIACGKPIYAQENIEGFAAVEEDVGVDFALKCKGDSMVNAHIFDGDIVYIKKQDDVDNGEIAAIIIEDEATLKRIYKYPNRIELRPENPLFPVLNYEGEDLNHIKIIGKAIVFMGKVR